jgi:hypothetical protein
MIAGAAVVGGALATSGVIGLSPAGATVNQPLVCSSIDGVTPSITAAVQAKATLNKTTKVITLSGVEFSMRNTFGISATISDIKFELNDPNNTSAPYVANSAAVAATPAGWTAGHDTELFEQFAGSQTFKAFAVLSTAKLSASYTDLGPAKTVIKFTMSPVTFTLDSPVQASVTCTPKTPEQVIAKVSE